MKKSSKNKKEIWLKYLLNNAYHQYKPLEIYWKVQNRSYSCRIIILISFATLSSTDLCKLVDNRTSGSNNTGPASGLVLSLSVQWLGLGLKIGCAFKIPSRKKSSDYLANSRKAQQQVLALLKSRGATENLSQERRPPYQWRQPHSMRAAKSR